MGFLRGLVSPRIVRRTLPRAAVKVAVSVVLLGAGLGARSAMAQTSSVPRPWVAQDIGGPTPAGSTTFSSGTFTVKAGGRDIYDSADQFHFVEQPVTGDIDIRARIDSLQQTDDYAKAGVMIRSALTGNASNAFAAMSSGDGVALQRRRSTGGSTSISWGDDFAIHMWVRLVRSKSTLTAYSSVDGTTWTKTGSGTVTLGSTVYVGLAVTSHKPGTLTTATFSQVSVSAAGAPVTTSPTTPPPATTTPPPTTTTPPPTTTTPPPTTTTPPSNQAPVVSLTSPANNSGLTAPASITVAATASDPESRMARVDFYNGTTLIGSDTTSPYSMTWSSVPAGTYSFHAKAFDLDGGNATSAAANVAVSDVIVAPPPTTTPPPPTTITPPPATSTTITPGPGALYISPSGNDRNTGTATSPLKTFATAFVLLRPGGELVLLDGTYGQAEGTGYINYQGTKSAQVPSGSASAPTYVHALHPGAVKINGQLFIGRSNHKDSYIVIEGISFEGGSSATAASIYNSDHVTIRNGGFHSTVNDGGGVFDVGTNDGSWGNTNNLFEDLWIWGQARAIFDNYRADFNTWRRIVVRGDGCSSSDCAGSGNPNIGTTVYDSQGVTFENVIVLDRILIGSGNNYADFAVAQHTPGIPGGNNQWLGVMSINAPDHGFYMEPDQQTLNPSNTLINVVAWKPKEDNSFNRSGTFVIQHSTFWNGIASGDAASATATNVLLLSGSASGFTTSGLSTSDPAMQYPLRSALGATVEFRYVNRTLTSTPLWPWANEDRIKADMCAGVSRGFCSDTSLTHYIWNLMGHGSPY